MKKILHWADNEVQNLIRVRGNKKKYICASGVTPSGTIHIGNFREMITADLIVRALKDKGKDTRFIHSWDDNDVFRKIPKNLPNQEQLKKELRKPIYLIKDPFKKYKSYAEHFEKEIEKELPILGINPEYIYQHKLYSSCKYAKEIKIALEQKEKIIKILNNYRKEPLSKNWLPIFVFCNKCNRDTTKKINYLGNYEIYYECECGHKETFDFRKKGIVTLRWRIDWPMHWQFYNEDFESAGKDHFAAGGSITTAKQIQKEIYNTDPPYGFAYEWISPKGLGQFSSSSGNVITLSQMMEIYEPELIRWIFASTRPNTEFTISFDADVIKLYEDFDRTERIYFKKEKVSEKRYKKEKRIYELSIIDPKKIPKKIPFQPSFRYLTNILLMNQLDISKSFKHYKKNIKTKLDEKKLKTRIVCAKNWLEKYAPENFKYSINKKSPKVPIKYKKIFNEISKLLKKKKYTEKELHNEFYNLINKYKLDNKEFFKYSYKILINKEKGPKLARFILDLESKAINLFDSLS
jgi:lysyl-tRNA synthetase, class I